MGIERHHTTAGPVQQAKWLLSLSRRFAAKRLEINAVTKGRGEVRVEVLDAAGRVLKGWEPSAPITGDSVRHAVAFPGTVDMAALAGKPVCLRFHLRDAELYAFAFRD